MNIYTTGLLILAVILVVVFVTSLYGVSINKSVDKIVYQLKSDPTFFYMFLILIGFLVLPTISKVLKKLNKGKKNENLRGKDIDVDKIEEIEDILQHCPYLNLERIGSTLRYLSLKTEPPIISIVEFILVQAVGQRASDIHIEPTEKESVIKYRIDGILNDVVHLPKEIHNRIVSRLRIMAKLIYYKTHLPQDGRISTNIKGKNYEVRLSILPTLHGSKCVIRLFEIGLFPMTIDNLGLLDEQKDLLLSIITKPQGIIYLTGPTGCGKTTTIYAILKYLWELKKGTVNIVTIEDPIEIDIPFFNQTQVNRERGLTFAKGLRTIMRQDPDIIFVGEIRDEETADIAIKAGLTGHLVFTTVHSESSAGVFNRLMVLNVEPFLLASASLAVISQRLVRVLCPKCKYQTLPPYSQLKKANLPANIDMNFYDAKGCEYCEWRRYRGRTGVFEILKVEGEIRDMILKRKPSQDLLQIAKENGMISLYESALKKVDQGITSLEELLRVL